MESIIDIAALLDSHVLIYGPPGSGKTTFIIHSLRKRKSNINIIVFDTLRSFKKYTDYYGELSINPLEYLKDFTRFCDIINEILFIKYRNSRYLLSPAMEEILIRNLKKLGTANLEELFKILNNLILNSIDKYERLSTLATLRRLRFLDNKIFKNTDDILKKLIENRVDGVAVGVDLSYLSDVQKIAYVLFLVEATRVRDSRDIVFIIDEAHIYFPYYYSILLENIKISRNFRRYFILSTQSIEDIPSNVLHNINVRVNLCRDLLCSSYGLASIEFLGKRRVENVPDRFVLRFKLL